MREISVIKTELESLIQNYRNNEMHWNPLQISQSNESVKLLRQELNEAMLEGVNTPSNVIPFISGPLLCVERVIKTDKIETGVTSEGEKTFDFTNIYGFEVGCSIWVTVLGVAKEQKLCSKGSTREEAISNWNNGVYSK